MKPIVEIVCCSAQDCIDATRAGARRIELCTTIELGGLTPSAGLLQVAKQSVDIPIMAMVRPRPGGFCYSELEFETMLAGCDALDQADGLVMGVLLPDRSIDVKRARQLVKAAGKREKVFHRAFDQVTDPITSMEILIDIGFTRILTSGLAPTAVDGLPTLQLLMQNARGRIEIMPGGGVRSANARDILASGCTSIHLAPLREVQDSTGGSPIRVVDPTQVEAVVSEASQPIPLL